MKHYLVLKKLNEGKWKIVLRNLWIIKISNLKLLCGLDNGLIVISSGLSLINEKYLILSPYLINNFFSP